MERVKDTKIIMGFPGVGKTYIKEKYKGIDDLTILDSDSSNFDKSDFPNNYINYIENQIGKFDIILISTHQDVRKAIKESNIINTCKIYICYPDLELKTIWLERLKNRGNNDKFIQLISNNYENWITDIKNNEYDFIHIELNDNNSYLSNNLYAII